MFDIGFWELSIIGVVALLVIGPERLPSVARTAGLWFGRMRGFVSTVKADIDKQLKAEDLQRIMTDQTNRSGLHEIIEETKAAVDSLSRPADYLVKSDSNTVSDAVTPTDSDETKQQGNDSKS
jgi:sec-independent protein translocase protein TatB